MKLKETPVTTSMTQKDVKLREKETIFQGYNQIDQYRLRTKLFEGGWSSELERDVYERGHGVIVIAFDPDKNCLVFVEQFRQGVYAAVSSKIFDKTISPWTLEFVSGNIADGEAPETVASRELFEEAGCKILEMVPVGHYFVSPSGSSQSVYVFCAWVNAPRTGQIRGLNNEGEDIKVHSVTTEKVFELLESGTFNTLGTVYCLQWFRAHYDQLTQLWGTKTSTR